MTIFLWLRFEDLTISKDVGMMHGASMHITGYTIFYIYFFDKHNFLYLIVDFIINNCNSPVFFKSEFFMLEPSSHLVRKVFFFFDK